MTQYAIVDTTVLYAAGNRRATHHEEALAIVKAADRGDTPLPKGVSVSNNSPLESCDLPVLRIPGAVLIETMNGLHRTVGHDTAVDMLNRLQAGSGFETGKASAATWSTATRLFQDTERLSLGDALIVTDAHHHDIPYIYSFDTDFDGINDLTRLNKAEGPYV